MTTFQVKDACRAVTECNRHLLVRPASPEEAWRVIEPYVSCTGILGEFPLGNDALIQMLLTAAADVQAELQHPEEAAFLYREAGGYAGSFAFAPSYSRLVIRNRLVDHMDPALEAVRHYEAQWRGHSMAYRMACRVLWIVLYVSRYPHVWGEYRDAERHVAILKQIAAGERGWDA